MSNTTGNMSDKPKTITWTLPMLRRFKVAYEQAVRDKKDTFVFDGNEFVQGYAKYLIEFLEGHFRVKP